MTWKRRTMTFTVLLVVVVASLIFGAAPAMAQSYTTHVVQPGDTLSKIAQKYCTTWQEVYSMNQAAIGPDPSVIEPGTVLTVVNRCSSGGGSAGGVYDRGPSQHATGTYSAPYYTVAWGDTLTSIAGRFGVSVDALKSANGISGSTISPGQVLIIPGASGAVAPTPPPAGSSMERVNFAPGAISAARSGVIVNGVPQRYILTIMGGQRMQVLTQSYGEGLLITVNNASGGSVPIYGTNGQLSNSVETTIPYTGDYIVTVAPVVQPESQTLYFDITFVIQ